jgi:hypothetical protein
MMRLHPCCVTGDFSHGLPSCRPPKRHIQAGISGCSKRAGAGERTGRLPITSMKRLGLVERTTLPLLERTQLMSASTWLRGKVDLLA